MNLNHKSFFTYPDENEVGENYILLHCNKPEWLVLNNSALEIAQSLENREHPDAISEKLVLKYGVPRESANQDVLYVLEQLKSKGFSFLQIFKTITCSQVSFFSSHNAM